MVPRHSCVAELLPKIETQTPIPAITLLVFFRKFVIFIGIFSFISKCVGFICSPLPNEDLPKCDRVFEMERYRAGMEQHHRVMEKQRSLTARISPPARDRRPKLDKWAEETRVPRHPNKGQPR
jgi:hypothetical protein